MCPCGRGPPGSSSLLTALPAGWGSLRSGAGGLERAGAVSPGPRQAPWPPLPPGDRCCPSTKPLPAEAQTDQRRLGRGCGDPGEAWRSLEGQSRHGFLHPRPRGPGLSWEQRPSSLQPEALPERCPALSSEVHGHLPRPLASAGGTGRVPPPGTPCSCRRCAAGVGPRGHEATGAPPPWKAPAECQSREAEPGEPGRGPCGGR